MQFTRDITGFTGGVSQQPAPLRSDTQYQSGENCWPSLTYGNAKRPPASHVAVLASKVTAGAFTHPIFRSTTEEYVAIITGDTDEPIEVYKPDGTKCVIRYGHLDEDFVYTADADVKRYATALSGNTAGSVFKAVTIADHTLIANTLVTCAMTDTVDTIEQNHEGVAYIMRGVAGTTYNIYLNDTLLATYASGESTNYNSYKTSTIAANLAASLGAGINVTIDPTPDVYTYQVGFMPAGVVTVRLNDTILPSTHYVWSQNNNIWTITFNSGLVSFTDGVSHVDENTGLTVVDTPPDTIFIAGSSPAGYSVLQQDSLVRVNRADGAPFKFRVSDSWGDQASLGIYRKVQDYESLPPRYFAGSILEISGDPSNSFDNYWIRYNNDTGSASGTWEETRKPGMKNILDPATLPHRLVRTGTAEFTFADIEWTERKVGDEISCSEPSFIGKTINDIFYYRNRLGLFAGENLITSKAGDYFNFWPTTATDTLDDDPIDVSANVSDVTLLKYALPYEKTLLGFGDRVQVEFSTGSASILSGKTVVSNVATKYPTSHKCKPVLVGSNAFFAIEDTRYTTIREYFIQPDGVSYDAADVTAHCPQYLPANVTKLVGSSAHDLLFAFSPDDPTAVYVYKYYWQGDQKAQSAWDRWVFPFDLVTIEVLQGQLYLITNHANTANLWKIDLGAITPESWLALNSFMVCLDGKCSLQGQYDLASGTTSWTLPYTDTTDREYTAVGVTGFPVVKLTKSGSTVSALGDHTSGLYTVGLTYNHKVHLSKFVLKDGNNRPYLHGYTTLRTLAVGYAATAYFAVVVTVLGREPDVYLHSPITAGCALNTLLTDSGVFTDTLLMGDSEEVDVTIQNDTCYPSIFVNASVEGTFTSRARKI